VLKERLADMADRTNRHNYSIGDYWNAAEEAADRIATLEAERLQLIAALRELIASDNRADGTHGGPWGGALDPARALLRELGESVE
jgi:hypothetical protein